MGKRAKTVLVSNLCIACVLVGLTIAVFTTDLSSVFLSVSAPLDKGNINQPNISLMFQIHENSNETAVRTDEILNILEQYKVKATFFVSGYWTIANGARVKAIAEAGHELGNYGLTATDMKKMNESKIRKEISDCHAIVKIATAGITFGNDNNVNMGGGEGIDMKLFSPPFGSFSKNTLKAANKLGYKTIMWSRDAGTGDATSIFNRSVTNPGYGELILLHPTGPTADTLAEIIESYRNKSYNIIPVSQNIG